MNVLMVEDQLALADLWASSLRRQGAEVTIATSQDDAIRFLQAGPADILILNLSLRNGSPLAVADYASYRHPGMRIIPVTPSTFFSDGSVFAHVPNTCTVLAATARPEDMAAIVTHYAAHG